MNALPSSSSAPPGPSLSSDQLVASSAGWVAVTLNLGCQGLGYIYQRRWGAFWIGGGAALAAAVVLGLGTALLTTRQPTAAGLQPGSEGAEQLAALTVMGAYAGVLAVGVGSAVEAGLAVNRSRRRLAAGPPRQGL